MEKRFVTVKHNLGLRSEEFLVEATVSGRELREFIVHGKAKGREEFNYAGSRSLPEVPAGLNAVVEGKEGKTIAHFFQDTKLKLALQSDPTFRKALEAELWPET